MKGLAKKFVNALGYTIGRLPPRDRLLRGYEDVPGRGTPRYLNIGAGSFRHPCWHNMDTPNGFYAEHQRRNVHIWHNLNSRQEFPLAADSLDAIYISHVIEHLSDPVVAACYRECRRCLRPGGILRITCPDMRLQYEAYRRRDVWFWPQPSPWLTTAETIEHRLLEHLATPLAPTFLPAAGPKLSAEEVRSILHELPMEEAFENIVGRIPETELERHAEAHVNWHTESKITRMLRAAGFSNFQPSRFGQSGSVVMRNPALFDNTCPELSLYVEAVK